MLWPERNKEGGSLTERPSSLPKPKIVAIDGPTLVMEANTSSITLSGSNTYHQRSKHFGLEWYATKEAVENGLLEIVWCSTLDQAADILTKPCVGAQFTRQRVTLMGAESLQRYFVTMVPPC